MSKNILGIFDAGDMESISTLIEKLEESSFDYLRLESDGVKIVIGKNGTGEVTEVSAPRAEAPAKSMPVPEVRQPALAVPAPAAEQSEAPVPAVADANTAGLSVVKSPSYGLFYAQPEPGSPPYVKLGDSVKAGDTMGLIEIMKTFTAVTADVSGKLVKIHVKNEQMLEPDMPLFSIQAE